MASLHIAQSPLDPNQRTLQPNHWYSPDPCAEKNYSTVSSTAASSAPASSVECRSVHRERFRRVYQDTDRGCSTVRTVAEVFAAALSFISLTLEKKKKGRTLLQWKDSPRVLL